LLAILREGSGDGGGITERKKSGTHDRLSPKTVQGMKNAAKVNESIIRGGMNAGERPRAEG